MKQTDPQFKLRLTPELKQALEAAATKNERTLTGEIVDRLEQSFELAQSEASARGLIATLRGSIHLQADIVSTFLDLATEALNDGDVEKARDVLIKLHDIVSAHATSDRTIERSSLGEIGEAPPLGISKR